MRKGRSQRKTRGSLPPTSMRPQSRLAGSAAPSSAGPQVVVGHAAPRAGAEEYVDGTSRHAEALAEVRETRSERDERYEPAAPVAKLELAESERLEPAHDAQDEHEEAAHAQPELEQTARVETLTFAVAGVAEPPSSAFDDPSDDAADAVNALATAPVKAESRATHVASLPTPEEMSIPPMGDLSVEPIADRFFSEGELVAARADHDTEEWDERAHKAVRKSRPEVVQRRARFAKYVRWAVGGAAVLCLAAVARSALPPSGASASGTSASLSQTTVLEAPASKAASVAVVAPAAPALPGSEPVAAAEPVSAPVVAVPAAVAPAAPVAPVAAAADAPPAPAVATSDKTALQEKNDSRRALERGKLADAIAAGERSVALDPTDGEAWLLLGAAYQEKGKNADARRCYSSCVKEGKRGPLGECRALIH
jgi:tetratricopeptide (TPR) repeat protein